MLYLNGNPVPTTIFPDNTSQVWKLPEEILTQTNYARVTWKFSHEGEIMHLAQLKTLLQLHRIRTSLILPYLPYGRQDKEISNTSTFALRNFANFINTMDFEEVIITDPHSEIALELIEHSRAVYLEDQVDQIWAHMGGSTQHYRDGNAIVCYPDKGALSKYADMYGLPHIYGEKVRDQLTGNITSYKIVGDPAGKNVLIVDDICDGGATFKILAKDLLAAGANKVVLFVTHGIFSKGVRTLFDSGIEQIFTKDGEVSKRHGSIQL